MDAKLANLGRAWMRSARLTSDERRALSRWLWDGLSEVEIANDLRWGLRRVKGAIIRGRHKLKRVGLEPPPPRQWHTRPVGSLDRLRQGKDDRVVELRVEHAF